MSYSGLIASGLIEWEPGIYSDLPFDTYAAIDALNPSLVLSMKVSPREFNHRRTHPKDVTDAMRFGSALHCAALEPDQFPLRYVVWDGGRRYGKAWDEFCAANEGKDSISVSEYETCIAARDAIRGHPKVGPLLKLIEPGMAEVSMVWRDPGSGLLCKSRADAILPGPMILDLKTTRAKVADDHAIMRIASQFGYHISMAARSGGYGVLMGELPPSKIVFAEQFAPHDCRLKNVPTDLLARGYDEWQRLLVRIAECEQAGVWPGCDEDESDLHVWQDGGDEGPRMTLDGEEV